MTAAWVEEGLKSPRFEAAEAEPTVEVDDGEDVDEVHVDDESGWSLANDIVAMTSALSSPVNIEEEDDEEEEEDEDEDEGKKSSALLLVTSPSFAARLLSLAKERGSEDVDDDNGVDDDGEDVGEDDGSEAWRMDEEGTKA